MRFTKYHKFGAYHWALYEQNKPYQDHVARIKRWITEKNILDVGAGDGLITSVLGAKGIDNEPEAVRLAGIKGVDVVLGDAYRLPYKDKSFDAVLMADVLEHLECPEDALKEAKRVADCLYVITPVIGNHFDEFHYTEWNENSLKEMVKKEGFKTEDIFRVPEVNTIYAKFKI